jgi:hypothetical protein
MIPPEGGAMAKTIQHEDGCPKNRKPQTKPRTFLKTDGHWYTAITSRCTDCGARTGTKPVRVKEASDDE